MTDEQLRHADRLWRATGDTDAEARSLIARVRSGAIKSETVEFAARCGHPAALKVTGLAEPASDPAAWARDLDRAALIRAEIVALWIGELLLTTLEGRVPEHDRLWLDLWTDVPALARRVLEGTCDAEEGEDFAIIACVRASFLQGVTARTALELVGKAALQACLAWTVGTRGPVDLAAAAQRAVELLAFLDGSGGALAFTALRAHLCARVTQDPRAWSA